jgi:hypothetical protein
MPPTADPATLCERPTCGHRRDDHYDEHFTGMGKAFACCTCDRFVEPGTWLEVKHAEDQRFERDVKRIAGLLRDEVAAWFKKWRAGSSRRRRPSSSPRR